MKSIILGWSITLLSHIVPWLIYKEKLYKLVLKGLLSDLTKKKYLLASSVSSQTLRKRP
jgi:hypothetical protein